MGRATRRARPVIVAMDLPKSMGVMVLPSVNLFPHAVLPLFIFEARYRRMLRDALESHRLFCIAMRRNDGAEEETPASVAGVGVVRASVENADGTSNIILQGVTRVSLGRVLRRRPYRVHVLQAAPTVIPDASRLDPLVQRVRKIVGERFRQRLPDSLKQLTSLVAKEAGGEWHPALELLRSLSEVRDPGMLADLVSCTLLPDPAERQAMLETLDLEQRLRILIELLSREEGGESGPSPEV